MSFIIAATLLLMFFFSSRRRHTRLVSDWSSDVCSSDLASTCSDERWRAAHEKSMVVDPELARLLEHPAIWRSEERRVGKECSSRRSTHSHHTRGRAVEGSRWLTYEIRQAAQSIIERHGA